MGEPTRPAASPPRPDPDVDQLRARIVELEQELALVPALRQEAEELRREADKRIGERDRALEEVERIEHHAEELRAALDLAEGRARDLAAEVDRLAALVDEMESSASWRLTRPVRRLRRAGRGD